MTTQTADRLLRENEELRRRLEEAEDTLRAIRNGEVDAVVVGADREQVFTLEAATKPYRLLVEQMPQAAATLTAEGRIVYANRRFAALLGRPLAALLGAPIQGLAAPDSRPLVEALLRDSQAGETVREVTLRRADGTPVSVHLGASAWHEGALGPCLVVTDLTEQELRKRAEQLAERCARLYEAERRAREQAETEAVERRRTEEALREADRRKDEFLALLGHELRNPLAPLHNAVEVLNRIGTPGPEATRLREMIDRQLAHLTRLIDDLLDVSRVARGTVRLDRQPCDLTALVREVAGDYRGQLEAGGLTFTVDVPARPLWVLGDRTRLRQVLGNLLHNARKFSDAGGRVDVRLGAGPDGRVAVLTVRDTGVGIEPAVLCRLFDTFGRAERSAGHGRGGLGLGLDLVRGLVQLHGGEVEVTSAGHGRGTTVTVRLPLAEAPAAPPEPPTAPPAGHRPYRMLLVEDEADTAESMQLLLELFGHQVRVAPSGACAVEAARQAVPEVVLCDIGLPGGMDGYAVARALRREPSLAATRLIALTGYGQDEDQRRALEAGFDAHLTKPVRYADLQRLLASMPARC